MSSEFFLCNHPHICATLYSQTFDFTFTQKANDSTVIPVSTEILRSIAHDGESIYFAAIGREGIYTLTNGQLSVVVDTTNIVPGGISPFIGIYDRAAELALVTALDYGGRLPLIGEGFAGGLVSIFSIIDENE